MADEAVNRMPSPIKFTVISREAFYEKYEDASGSQELDASWKFGEILIPGHGWHGCLIVDDIPSHYWDEDDGWQQVPRAVFKRV
jgi:hypothetical protein